MTARDLGTLLLTLPDDIQQLPVVFQGDAGSILEVAGLEYEPPQQPALVLLIGKEIV